VYEDAERMESVGISKAMLVVLDTSIVVGAMVKI
jgi:hypothetical protein